MLPVTKALTDTRDAESVDALAGEVLVPVWRVLDCLTDPLAPPPRNLERSAWANTYGLVQDARSILCCPCLIALTCRSGEPQSYDKVNMPSTGSQ
jgi:hypothetical protein